MAVGAALGGMGLTFQEDRKGQRRKSALDAGSSEKSRKRGRKRAPVSEIGSALRSVYDRALAEDIPPEMLDLLGKLG